jgi:hypothetical protein
MKVHSRHAIISPSVDIQSIKKLVGQSRLLQRHFSMQSQQYPNVPMDMRA